MDKIVGVYIIISPSNKIYVGQSWDINKRWCKYRNLLCKSQSKLYNSLIKHGVDNHQFQVIEEYLGNNQYELNVLEINHWLRLKSEGYEMLNCREPNGSGGKLSNKTKLKIGLANKGKKRTEKTKLLLSNKLKGNGLGRKLSLKTKNKISLSKKGTMSIEQRNKIIASCSKLDREIILKIKNMLNSNYKQKEIANIFGVDQTTISNIKTGKHWNNITK